MWLTAMVTVIAAILAVQFRDTTLYLFWQLLRVLIVLFVIALVGTGILIGVEAWPWGIPK